MVVLEARPNYIIPLSLRRLFSRRTPEQELHGNLSVSLASERGRKHRWMANEDRVAAILFQEGERPHISSTEDIIAIGIVGDGMSGNNRYVGGDYEGHVVQSDVASESVVSYMQRALQQEDFQQEVPDLACNDSLPLQHLARVAAEANNQLFYTHNRGIGDDQRKLGTTLGVTMVSFDRATQTYKAYSLTVGDSLPCEVARGGVTTLTAPDQDKTNPRMLTQWMGQGIRTPREMLREGNHSEVTIAPGSAILLHTDGIRLDFIASQQEAVRSGRINARGLVWGSVARPHSDDASAVLFRVC